MIKKKNNQTLTTFIGGAIDKTSYVAIGACIFGVILFCSLYFWLINPYGHGTNTTNLRWFDSLYFCVITFSSLGYGDIAPIGFGKFMASFQVLSGLILIAVFVGKIASERQSAMLRLIYTSEHQRRIVDFEKELYLIDEQIDKALDEHNHDKLYSLSRSTYRFLASIHNYLHFQANQGGLASYGNTSSLKRLYQSVAQIQQTLYEAIRTYGIQQRTKLKFEQTIIRINSIAKAMSSFHSQDEKIKPLLLEIQQLATYLDKWKEQHSKGNVKLKYRSVVTDYLLFKVKDSLPPQPWPKHIHKKIATELEIQNLLAQKCIDRLIKDGHIT
ncbi:potassium channel family protein [Adhaeribacter arboris]|nr:potassium channel family protein [Adhaeribacter arboris]